MSVPNFLVPLQLMISTLASTLQYRASNAIPPRPRRSLTSSLHPLCQPASLCRTDGGSYGIMRRKKKTLHRGPGRYFQPVILHAKAPPVPGLEIPGRPALCSCMQLSVALGALTLTRTRPARWVGWSYPVWIVDV
ncbi:hypothetical protein K440DRAFT_612222 [Wilcoxina mikolae CBS 423.85]|nr:hypothetical protein K440DRAFT_612222 [Wilcoxina mikolae CBS 423.85]